MMAISELLRRLLWARRQFRHCVTCCFMVNLAAYFSRAVERYRGVGGARRTSVLIEYLNAAVLRERLDGTRMATEIRIDTLWQRHSHHPSRKPLGAPAARRCRRDCGCMAIAW
jgi:hypothetical protein